MFIKMMSHDLLVQNNGLYPAISNLCKSRQKLWSLHFYFVLVVFFLVGVALYNDLNSKLLSHNLVYRYTIEFWEMYEFINIITPITLYSQIFNLKTYR